MRRKAGCVLLVSIAAMVGCSSSGGSKGGNSTNPGGAPNRSAISCDSVLSNVASTGAFFPDASAFTIHSASWGDAPASMQVVPSGGTLCGALTDDSRGASVSRGTYIVTNLWGQALYDFYSPLVPSGCTVTPLSSDGSGTGYRCSDGRSADVTADPANQFVALIFIQL
jgi:hypothetical protein